jgi:hypothetical protein
MARAWPHAGVTALNSSPATLAPLQAVEAQGSERRPIQPAAYATIRVSAVLNHEPKVTSRLHRHIVLHLQTRSANKPIRQNRRKIQRIGSASDAPPPPPIRTPQNDFSDGY